MIDNNMSSDYISIIIPVYNAEKYIEKCLSSITMQSYKCLEIIVVDDGSTDGSGEICDNFALNDDRVKVIHINNLGVAKARNIGLDAATGKYVMFSDSDDYFPVNAAEMLYNSVKECEYVSGAFITVDEYGNEKQLDYLSDFGNSIGIKAYISRMLDYQAGAYWGANWGKIFLNSIIKENGIEFESDVRFAEDYRFNLEYLKYVENIGIQHEPIYYYRISVSDSLSKKEREALRYWSEYRELYNRLDNLSVLKNAYDENRIKLNTFLLRAVVCVMHECVKSGNLNYKRFSEIFRKIKLDSSVMAACRNFETNKTKERFFGFLFSVNAKRILYICLKII